MITRRLEPGVNVIVGMVALAAGMLGHGFARLPSAHLSGGRIDRWVLAELAGGIVLAIAATAMWMLEGARRSAEQVNFTRIVMVSLLVGAAITGVVALVTEASQGCLGACG